MKRSTLILALTAAAAAPFAVQAGDAAVGAELAASCSGCHGPKGEGLGANPPINNLSSDELVKALEAYATGSRNHMMMKALTAGLSKEDMQDLAAYYASLK
jgi:cytochrome c553